MPPLPTSGYFDPTVAAVVTPRDLLNSGAVGSVAQGAQAIKLGNMCSKIKVVVAGLTGAGLTGASQNITTAAFLALATVTGISLKTGEILPAIGSITALGVAGGSTGATGARTVAPAGFTASTTVAAISDDGKTLTFEASVAGFTLVYEPAPYGGADQTVTESGP